jgi:hypothetical protein
MYLPRIAIRCERATQREGLCKAHGQGSHSLMAKVFVIWGREYTSDRDVVLSTVQNNPQAVFEGYRAKTLRVDAGTLTKSGKRKLVDIKKYTRLRIEEAEQEQL